MNKSKVQSLALVPLCKRCEDLGECLPRGAEPCPATALGAGGSVPARNQETSDHSGSGETKGVQGAGLVTQYQVRDAMDQKWCNVGESIYNEVLASEGTAMVRKLYATSTAGLAALVAKIEEKHNEAKMGLCTFQSHRDFLKELLVDFSHLAVPAVCGPVGEWGIDTSVGGPILVYKNCSVIEAEQAEYVLRLIAADNATPAPSVPLGGGEVCWLVEHFHSTGNSTGEYHTGMTNLHGESRRTRSPGWARRYLTQSFAEAAAEKLGTTMTGVWRAVEHCFHAQPTTGKRSTSAATASGHELPDAGESRNPAMLGPEGASDAVANGDDARVASAGCAHPTQPPKQDAAPVAVEAPDIDALMLKLSAETHKAVDDAIVALHRLDGGYPITAQWWGIISMALYKASLIGAAPVADLWKVAQQAFIETDNKIESIKDAWQRVVDRVLAAAPVAVEADMVLVPREPAPASIRAGRSLYGDAIGLLELQRLYRAMIAAAPTESK